MNNTFEVAASQASWNPKNLVLHTLDSKILMIKQNMQHSNCLENNNKFKTKQIKNVSQNIYNLTSLFQNVNSPYF